MNAMRQFLLSCGFLFFSFVLSAQDENVRLKGDAAIYTYALQKYLDAAGRSDGTVIVEWNDGFSRLMPKTISNVKISNVLKEDYINLIRKKKLKEVVVIYPISSLMNGEFEVSVCKFKLSYKKKSRTLISPNAGGARIYMRYDCEKNEFIVLRVVDVG
jgi:hypothetical protein